MASSHSQWELQQLKDLQEVAQIYGWMEDNPKYKERIKLIQVKAVARLKDSIAAFRSKPASSKEEGEEPKASGGETPLPKASKRPKPGEWVLEPGCPPQGRRFKDFTHARKLLPDPPFSAWITDRDAPSGQGWRRFISVNESNDEHYLRARIVLNKGVPPPCLPDFTACLISA